MTTTPQRQAEQLTARIKALPDTDKPTLVYFGVIGICWPIGCLLHQEGVDYERIDIPLDAWTYKTPQGRLPLKESFRNGHLPLYVDREVQLGQSNVILSYLGEKHGLMGDSPAEKLATMEVMAHAYDALFHWNGLFQVNTKLGVSEAVFEARLQAFLGHGSWGVVGNGYGRNLEAFERYLTANSARAGGFMVGSRLSVADLYAFNVLCNWYKAFDPSRFVAHHPRLDAYIRRIAAIPGVRQYIDQHQKPTTWFSLPGIALKLTEPEDLLGLV